MKEVYLTRTANFLPNSLVENEDVEEFLGLINGQKSKSKLLVLRSNKIKGRYYAIDKQGNTTHTNAQMVSEAVRALFKQSPEEIKSVDLLCCGTSSPDQLMPSHAVMVHGYLPEMNSIEVVSPSGVCCSGMHALKYAFNSIKCGDKTTAVTTGSERLAKQLRSEQFEEELTKLQELEERPYLAFEKDFLRWMLSDGAGAFLLSDKPNENDISLKIEWIDGRSYANVKEACMYMAATKNEDGTLTSFVDLSKAEIIDQSVMSIKQDVKLLSENIIELGFQHLADLMKVKDVDVKNVDHFLPHLSSYFFEDKIADILEKHNVSIPKEKWFTNLATKGNVGAGSIYLMVDELFNSGKLKKGEKILLMVPESSRFSYVYCYLTVC
ncbi:beta-ketoacyl-ACP synthase III [Crocinitomix catalasitica]|uniref:beta-ketoacyl-ACP synthase III n=1 Tax=Crocinitomix catalasitica TaxID=184607 RepID=UPI00047F595C|nr:beta-ketoacyl-ACP synthase III [Crocinitomix catalasitica]